MLTYLHGDALGSASLATSVTGTVVSSLRYYPYGGTRSGSMATDRRYTGQRWEASVGFYDYGARSYDPALGRFLQADSIVSNLANPQSFNRYSYVLNNPLKYTDPTGHIAQDEVDEAAALLSALAGNGVEITADWGMRNRYWYPGSWTLEQLTTLENTVGHAKDLTQQFQNGDITALEALVQLVDWRAQIGQDDRFVSDISICILGDEGLRAVWSPWLHGNRYSPSFLWDEAEGGFLGADSGFRAYYQDGSAQPRHFWMYVNAAYVTENRDLVRGGVDMHEDNNWPWGRLNNGGGTGLDRVLGYRGCELGLSWRSGAASFSEAGGWIQRNLGPVSTLNSIGRGR